MVLYGFRKGIRCMRALLKGLVGWCLEVHGLTSKTFSQAS